MTVDLPETWIDDLFTRLLLVERLALDDSEIATIDITNDWPFSSNTFPYVVNRLLASTDDSPSEDVRIDRQNVGIRIVAGHVTEAGSGLNPLLAYRILVILRDYLSTNKFLKLDAVLDSDDTWLLDEPEWIGPQGLELGPHTGIGIFATGGVGNQQIGVELSIVVPVISSVY